MGPLQNRVWTIIQKFIGQDQRHGEQLERNVIANCLQIEARNYKECEENLVWRDSGFREESCQPLHETYGRYHVRFYMPLWSYGNSWSTRFIG